MALTSHCYNVAVVREGVAQQGNVVYSEKLSASLGSIVLISQCHIAVDVREGIALLGKEKVLYH